MAQEESENINPIDLQKSLKGVDFPADKQALRDKAEENGADDAVMDFLERIPERRYDTPAEVSKQLSGDQR